MRSSESGFSLIELMVVVAIIAIIAAIAFPSYQSQVQATRRSAVQTEMLEIAQNLERCMTRTNSYNVCNIDDENSVDGRYALALNADNSTYTITATPIAGESQEDDPCGIMTLNQLGVKGAEEDDCWE